MGWKHQCRKPGTFRIWLRQATSGAGWSCRCGAWYTLHRRSFVPGHWHWEWHAPMPEAEQQGGHISESYSATERAYDEDEPVQTGFRMER